MTIEYELTMQDYIDYSLYHYHHSASVKRNLLSSRMTVPVMLLLIALLLSHRSKTPDPYGYTMAIIISVLWVVFYPRYWDRVQHQNIIKMVSEGKNDGMFRHHQFTVTSEGLVDETKIGEYRNNTIDRIVESDKHIFIYISSLNAYIVPKRVFKSAAEQQVFLEIVSSIPKL
ncbi:MAG: YcxB family protein [Armatimonadota bacterium]